jgi:hypothetical protein
MNTIITLNTLLLLNLCCNNPIPQQDTTIQGGTLKESFIESYRRKDISVKRLSSDQFKMAPSMLGETDILRAVQMMPGITGGKEGNASVMIRGGNYDQTDFLMDGGTLFNPAHLLGFVSAFNPEMVSSLDVYKGELPAWFGGRLSGVVDIHGRDGDFDRYHAGVTVGVLSSNVWAEGPIVRDRLSFIVGARKSYFNLIMYPLYRKVADQGSFVDTFENLGYYDAHARLAFRAGARDYVSLTFYMGNDRMDLGSNKMEGTSAVSTEFSDAGTVKRDDKYDARSLQAWGNTMAALDWDHATKDGGAISGLFSYSFFRNDFSSRSHLEYLKYAEKQGSPVDAGAVITELEKGVTDKDFIRRNKVGEMKADFKYNKVFGNHDITLGAAVSEQQLGLRLDSNMKVTVNKLNPTPSDDMWDDIDSSDSTSLLTSLALYADDLLQILPGLAARGSLRGQMWSVKGKTYFCLEPRVSVKLTVADAFSLAAGYNRTSQAIHQITSSTIVTPGDIWVPVTPDIRPMTADQVYVELTSSIPLGEHPLRLSLEGYYKTMDNLLEWTDLALVSDSVDWTKNVSMGRGKAYGIEFSAEKTMGKLYSSLTYTWSKSLRQFDDLCKGEEFFAANDRRHDLNVLAQYKFSRKWDMSAAFSYHTGDRFTLNSYVGLGNMFNYNDPGVYTGFIYYKQEIYPGVTTVPIDVGERNNFCMKDYHRLDLGLNYHMYHRSAQSTINFSIYNLYNRLNPYTLLFDYDQFDQPLVYNVCIMPFMPSLTYTLMF